MVFEDIWVKILELGGVCVSARVGLPGGFYVLTKVRRVRKNEVKWVTLWF
jgi:hypothetical protein